MKQNAQVLAAAVIALAANAFLLNRVQPVLNAPLDASALANLKQVINNYTDASMQVVLDMHNYGALTRNTSVAVSGTLTRGSAAIPVSSTDMMYPGYTLSGPGIPSAATVKTVDSPTQITMQATVTISATLAAGSAAATIDTTNAYPGFTITGPGIPAGTTVLSIDSATQLTMSAPATADGSVTVTLGTGASTTSTALITCNAVSKPIGDPNGGVSIAEFAYSWSLLAAAVKDNPKVAIDLQNEPASLSAAAMASASQAAITAIRNTGFTGWIHVEGGGGYAGAHNFVSTGAAAQAVLMNDPLNKLIFHVHQYLDNDFSGRNAAAVAGLGAIVLQPATTFARANGLKLFLGEFGVSVNSGNLAENQAMLDFMHANSDVWVGWTAWGGGQYWSQNYVFRMDPFSLSAPVADWPQVRMIAAHKI